MHHLVICTQFVCPGDTHSSSSEKDRPHVQRSYATRKYGSPEIFLLDAKLVKNNNGIRIHTYLTRSTNCSLCEFVHLLVHKLNAMSPEVLLWLRMRNKILKMPSQSLTDQVLKASCFVEHQHSFWMLIPHSRWNACWFWLTWLLLSNTKPTKFLQETT